MLCSTEMILNDLSDYSVPQCRLQRLVRDGKYIRLKRGMYEDDSETPGYVLASAIYNPSYLSFEYALAHYGLIPETAFTYTSATVGKNRTKIYRNKFGTYTYRDVPKEAFPYEIDLIETSGRMVWIATPEKCLCDKMYSIRPIGRVEDIELLLFEDFRIDENGLSEMNVETIGKLSEKYHSKNVKLLYKYLSG